jgi:hypothetical protein
MAAAQMAHSPTLRYPDRIDGWRILATEMVMAKRSAATANGSDETIRNQPAFAFLSALCSAAL